ncbi:aspartate carbamoyltransferase [Candidatus Saccharibacteria bacterium]|nr:MAG: aspartate carbamoyltransferase [Candidatus Saccharibacteria bacterium]
MDHLVAAKQLTPEVLSGLMQKAEEYRKLLETPEGRKQLRELYPDKVVATLFYEPSTRTRLSHESAAQRLGMGVVSTENAAEFSSAIKGETIEDTVRVVCGYADAIVIRHKETGIVDRAAAASPVPVINAGDGTGEHPTQALLDVYTIWREMGTLEGLNVLMGGDLAHGRTVRSLAQVMSNYKGTSFTFVSTPQLQMGDDIKALLKERGVAFTETDDVNEAVKQADVVYWTRLQKERLEDPTLEAGFVIDESVLQNMKEKSVIMHPLPRVSEITAGVDIDPRAAYFRQSHNGVYVRMALLDYLFSHK